MLIRFSLIILLLISCDKRAHIDKSSERGPRLVDITTEIFSVKTMPWTVGIKERKEISMGFITQVEVPYISSSAQDYLMKKDGIDAWIYEFRKTRGKNRRIYGYFNVSFTNINRSLRHTGITIFYSAAAASERFRRFKCPAFNHRRIIDDIDIINDSSKIFSTFIRRNVRVAAKVEDTQHFPISFGAGLELEGEYEFRVALYNSQTKYTHSKWFRVPGTIKIGQEEIETLPECSGVKQESNINNQPTRIKLENFQMK